MTHRHGNSGGHAKRISREQREEILRIYEQEGISAANARAQQLDLSSKYVYRLVYALGIA